MPSESGHNDPTVCDPAELEKIEEHFGFRIKDASPEMLQFIVERSKQAGNSAFKQKNYKGGLDVAYALPKELSAALALNRR